LLKIVSIILTISLLIYLSYLNLGKFLDATSKPVKTDVLVCLGGGNYKIRIEKTLELYEQNLSLLDTIVLTGYVNSKREVESGIVEDKRVTYLKEHTTRKINIILNKNLKNTAQEVKYVKQYLLDHKLKNATFITEPPHSRRILLFTKIISVDGNENFKFSVVGADYKNWNKERYYENKYAKNYAFSETVKIVYGLFVYGVLDKLGLLEWFEKYYSDELKKGKKDLSSEMNFISF